jgi:hypothetical protein
MATTTSITSTYAGEFAGKYISAALLSAPTIDEGGIEVMPNVVYKSVIQKVATDAIVKDATCDFTDTSTVTLTERIITPEEFQVNLELCKKDWVSAWQSVEMGYSAFREIPSSFADFLIGHVAEKVAQKIEQNIWNGTNASAGEFDGFLTTLAADGDVVDVSGTTITAANVIDQLGYVADAIPNAIYGKEDLNIYVPQNVARAYVRALGGFGASGLGANGTDNKGTQWFAGRGVGNIGLNFDGINLFVTNGLPSNKMVAAQKSNLFFGTGLLSDYNQVKVLDMEDLDGSQNFRVIMRFTAGIQHGIGTEVVLYS